MDKRVEEVIAKFPTTFGLRGFQGKNFRIAKEYCYYNDDSVQIVVETLIGKTWFHFSRTTEEELARELTHSPE